MKIVVRTLMFLACMLYGAMPAQSGVSVSIMEGMDHGKYAASMGNPEANSSDPCPHRETMTHAPFCAACLVLIPEFRFPEKGKSPHAYPISTFHRAFLGNAPAPPLPPPRA